MFRRVDLAVAFGLVAVIFATLLTTSGALAQPASPQPTPFTGIGRAATPKEVAAWDIDVRPDFKGLPKGSGSVAQGMTIWEGKCASCHGVFGESNEVFAPLVGGTSAADVKAGRAARLDDRAYPGRTTLMKLASLATLWDYIARAMPWNAPKSLATDEVYAVTAYMLNLGGVLPDDFTLTDRNMAEVQLRLPNRAGLTTDHALWPGATLGGRKPDVLATACMKNCPVDPTVASFLPDFARNAHGNLAEQNRPVGAQRGADTTRPAGVAAVRAAPVAVATVAAAAASTEMLAMAQKNTCTACHGMDSKVLGPSFREIANKYAGRADASAYLAGKVKAGSAGVWGAIAMPAQAVSDGEAKALAQWLATGAGK